MHHRYVFLIFWVSLFSTGIILPCAGQRSLFSTGTECWTTAGDGGQPVHHTGGGNPGGYLEVADLGQGQTWYFRAPGYFLGNKSTSYQNYFSYDIYTDHPGSSNGQDLIITGASGIEIYYDVPNNPLVTWTHVIVQLDTMGWRYTSSGTAVSLADFMTVIGQIAEIRIRGEFSSQLDQGGLDNVILEPIGDISTNATPVCQSGCFSFFDHTTTNPQSWQWYFPGGSPSTSTVHDPVDICYNTPGIYQGMLVQYNGCFMDTFRTLDIVIHGVITNEDTVLVCHDTLYPLPGGGYTNMSGSYADTLVSSSGCDSIVGLVLHISPQLQVAVQMQDAACYGELSGFIDLNTNGGTQPLDFSLNGNINSTGQFNQLGAGAYHYLVTDSFGCSVMGDVTLTQPDKIALHVSPGEVVKEFYESAPLSASADLPGAEFTWSPPDYLSCTVCPAPFTSTPLNTVYDVTATVLVNGHTCSADTQVTVLVNPVLYIPNTFTPNHDGINDVFEVSGSCFENMDDFYIGIYNRWGQLVTEGYATNFTWDGHDHNDLAQAGIYTYTLSYLNRNTGKYYNRLGHLQLLR